MESQLGKRSKVTLSSATECAAITDLCKEKGKRSKIGGRAQLVPAKVEGAAAGDGVDGKDENNAVVDYAEEDKVSIKRCELIMSKISLAKLGKEVIVSHTNAKARPARKAKMVKSIKSEQCAFVSASDANGSSVEVTDHSQVLGKKQQPGHSGNKSEQQKNLRGEEQVGFKKAANAKILGKSCKEKNHDEVAGNREIKETIGVKLPMKRCEVSIGRVSLTQLKKNKDIKQTKRRHARKSKVVSSNSLPRGLNTFVSNLDYIDSSIEVLDHSQDLSWELVEGGTWNETDKQIKKKERKSPKKFETLLSSSKEHHGPDKLPHQVTVSKKRRRAPLASENLASECIVDLKHCVEDEVEDEADTVTTCEDGADSTFKDGERGQRVKMFHSTMVKGYDCITADPTFVCVFCNHQPHRYGLGDLFGPYFVKKGGRDVWTHVDCAVWVPCVLLSESSGEVEGLSEAIRQTRKQTCSSCKLRGASIGCTSPGCTRTAHVRCAAVEGWRLVEENFEATCSLHLKM